MVLALSAFEWEKIGDGKRVCPVFNYLNPRGGSSIDIEFKEFIVRFIVHARVDAWK